MTLAGFNPIGRAVWVSGVSPLEKLLLLLIAVEADDTGFWPTDEYWTLAKMAGLETETVISLLEGLEQRGLFKCSFWNGTSFGALVTIPDDGA